MISYKQAISIFILYTMGSTIVSLGNRAYHSWQAFTMAFIFSIILCFIFQFLLKKFKHKNLYEMIDDTTNKYLAIILKVLYIIFSLYLASRILFNYVDFVSDRNLIGNNRSFIIIMIIILIIYLHKKGLVVFSRVAFCFVFLIIFITVGITILSGKEYNFSNLLPIIPYHTKNFYEMILIFVVQPFAETILLANIFAKCSEEKKNNQIYYHGFFITFIILLFYIIRNVAILGDTFILYCNYPLYSSIGTINALGFITRIESLSVILFFVTAIVELYVCSLSVLLGIKSIFKLNDQNHLLIPVIFFIGALSEILFVNLVELREFTLYFSVIASPFYLLIPLYLIIKKKRKNTEMSI